MLELLAENVGATGALVSPTPGFVPGCAETFVAEIVRNVY